MKIYKQCCVCKGVKLVSDSDLHLEEKTFYSLIKDKDYKISHSYHSIKCMEKGIDKKTADNYHKTNGDLPLECRFF